MLGQVGEAGPLLLLFPCWIWLWEGGALCLCGVATGFHAWRGRNPGMESLIVGFCALDNTAEQSPARCLFTEGLSLCLCLEKSFPGIPRFAK